MPTTTSQAVADFHSLETALKNNNFEAVKKILSMFAITATNEYGQTCLMIGCGYSKSPEVMKLIFEKIDDVGGIKLLQGQLTATNNDGGTCLMLACLHSSSSLEVVKLIFEKIFEAGGIELLTNMLNAADTRLGRNCLTHCCQTCKSPEVVNLIFEKIFEAGGTALLTSQFSATDKFGWTCLMHGCSSSWSPEVMKLVFQKIAEAGGMILLKKQLSATSGDGRNCLLFGSLNSFSPEVMTLVAAVLFSVGLFKQQYSALVSLHKSRLKGKIGIDSSSWTPDAASFAEIEILIKGASFIHAIHNNQQSKIKEFLRNDSEAKKIFDLNLDSIVRACAGPNATLETVNILFSEVELVCGDQFLGDLLKKQDTAGKTRLLSVSWSYPERLKLFLDIVDERTGSRKELLPEKKKTRRDYESFLFYALIKFAPNYRSLLTLISKIFDSEFFGRRYLREEFNSKPCLECLFARRLDSPDEMKMLLLIVSLYSITGVFEDRYSRLDKDAKKTLSLVCQIESGDWRSNNSSMGDVIGEIKNSFKY